MEEKKRKTYYQKKGGAGGKREGAGRPKRNCLMIPVQVPQELAEDIKISFEAVAVQMYPKDEERCKYDEEQRIAALKKIKPHVDSTLLHLETKKNKAKTDELEKR